MDAEAILTYLHCIGAISVGSYRSKVGERVRPFGDLSSRFGGYGKVGCEDG